MGAKERAFFRGDRLSAGCARYDRGSIRAVTDLGPQQFERRCDVARTFAPRMIRNDVSQARKRLGAAGLGVGAQFDRQKGASGSECEAAVVFARPDRRVLSFRLKSPNS